MRLAQTLCNQKCGQCVNDFSRTIYSEISIVLLGEAGLMDVVTVSGSCSNFVKTALGSEYSEQSRFREYSFYFIYFYQYLWYLLFIFCLSILSILSLPEIDCMYWLHLYFFI